MVHTAAFSPDGKKIVTASYDSTARIWDVESGKELHTLKHVPGHSAGVNTAVFSPDGKTIVTAGSDGTEGFLREARVGSVRIWDVESGKEIRRLDGYKRQARTAAFSPDGKKVIAAGWTHDNEGFPLDENAVLVWNANSGKVIQRLEGHKGYNTKIAAFSPDGKKILTVTDGATRIWDAESGKVLQKFEGRYWDSGDHWGAISSAAFSPDGKKIVTTRTYNGATADFVQIPNNTARIWDIESGKEIQQIEAEDKVYVNFASFSPDGTKILTPCVNAVRLWDVESGKELQKFVPAVLSSDIKPLLKPFYGDKTKKIQHGYKGENEDGRLSIRSGRSPIYTTRILDAESGEELQKFEYELSAHFKYAAFSTDGKKLIAVTNDTARIWDVESGKELKKWTWEISYWKN